MQHRTRLYVAVFTVATLLAIPAPAIGSVTGAAVVGGLAAVSPVVSDDEQEAASIDAPAFPLATGMELAMVDLTNADRGGSGVPSLSFDPALLDIARQRAAAQLNDEPLSHYDASGQLAFVGLLANAGIDYALAGENLARTRGSDPGTPTRVEQALMNSPTHRKNILEPAFTAVAVGVASDSSGRVAFAEIYRAAP